MTARWGIAVLLGLALGAGLAFQAGTLRGERDAVVRELEGARAATAAAKAAMLDLVKDRDALLGRVGDQAAVISDLGVQVDRMREGCAGVKP